MNLYNLVFRMVFLIVRYINKMATDEGGGVVDGGHSDVCKREIGPGLISQPGIQFFPLILVRIHTNEFIQLAYKLYLFINLVFGRNFIQSLHLKWEPMFLAIFFLLLNSRVHMYIGCTVKYSFGSFCRSPTDPQNWSSMGCDGLTPWSAGGGSLLPAPW